MSDTPEYILRPEVETYIYDDEQGASFSIKGKDQAFAWLDGNFHRVFVPLDRQALTEQIELLVKEARLQFLTNRQIAEREDLKDEVYEEEDRLTSEILVKQFLALFGLENKETE